MSSCENCGGNFTILRRKNICADCKRYHCSQCLTKSLGRFNKDKKCKKCFLLLTGNFVRSDLDDFKLRDMKSFLLGQNIDLHGCTERDDLIQLIMPFSNSSQYLRQQRDYQHRTEELRNLVRIDLEREHFEADLSNEGNVNDLRDDIQDDGISGSDLNDLRDDIQDDGISGSDLNSNYENENTDNSPSASASACGNSSEQEIPNPLPQIIPSCSPPNYFDVRQASPMKKDYLINVETIESYSIKELKVILTSNQVDFKGCCEKQELQTKVKQLLEDKIKTKKLYEEKDEFEIDDDICKICMDAIIDCVILECGHICSCTPCGRLLTECPICRQYVIRVVRTYKS